MCGGVKVDKFAPAWRGSCQCLRTKAVVGSEGVPASTDKDPILHEIMKRWFASSSSAIKQSFFIYSVPEVSTHVMNQGVVADCLCAN